MKTFVADAATRNKLEAGQCGTKDCTNESTYAVFILESLDQCNLLGVSCDEHKDILGEIFGELGVRTQVMTEPLVQFKKRIVGMG